MSLEKYKEKRNFKVSPEPSGKSHDPAGSQRDLLYVIQKHRASQLHYDFRLEFKGVLLSWGSERTFTGSIRQAIGDASGGSSTRVWKL